MSEVKRYDCSNGNAKFCYGCYQMDENPYGPWVQALDFDAAQSELSALREELAAEKKWYDQEVDKIQGSLTAAEQRNSELVELLRAIKRHDPDTQCMTYPMHRRIDAALKPTESGASE